MSAGWMPRILQPGFLRRADVHTGFHPKRNGNMRRGQERIRHIGGAEMSVPSRPIAGNATPARGYKQCLSVHFNRTRSGSMTPPAMPPNGWKTAGTIIIAAPLMTGRRGPPDNAGYGGCVEEDTTAQPNTCVRARGAGMTPMSDIPSTDFGFCGNCSKFVGGRVSLQLGCGS